MADDIIKVPVDFDVDAGVASLTPADNALKKVTNSAKGLSTQLQSTRNAGFAFNQILREAPSFAFSFQTGIVGISNNLPIFADALKKAREAGVGTGDMIKNLAGQLFSIPSLLSIGSLALVAFGSSLFSSGEAAATSEQQIRSFADQVEQLKANVQGIEDALDFSNRLGAINVQIRGGTDLDDLREQSVAQRQATQDLVDSRAKADADFKKFIGDTELSQQQLEEEWKKHSATVFEIDAKINKSRDDQRIIYRQIQNQKNKDEKKALEESIQAWNNYQKEIIAKAKAISSEIKKEFVVPLFSATQTQSQQFDIAQEFLKRFKDGTLQEVKVPLDKFTIRSRELILDPEQVKVDPDKFLVRDRQIKFNAEVDKVKPVNQGLLDAQFDRLSKLKPSQGFLGVDRTNEFKQIAEDAQKAADTISNALTPAFDGLVDAMFKGNDPIQAFFDGIKQGIQEVIQEFIKAQIRALIFRTILGAATGGVSGIAAGGRAAIEAIGQVNRAGNFTFGGQVNLRLENGALVGAVNAGNVMVQQNFGRSRLG